MTEALDSILKLDHKNEIFTGTAFDAIRKLVKYLRPGSKYGHSLGPKFISWCDVRKLATLNLRRKEFVEFAESPWVSTWLSYGSFNTCRLQSDCVPRFVSSAPQGCWQLSMLEPVFE